MRYKLLVKRIAFRYNTWTIRSFKDKVTKAVFDGKQPKGFPPQIFARARKKLELLDAAPTLESLMDPPGNQLELLGGDRKGQNSIRINNQFRICFRWNNDGVDDVEITDYH
ncbi:MAG: type II toxin-antitoxin system RelE/ParE family toxin [Beijerinckiaceae bacterium]